MLYLQDQPLINPPVKSKKRYIMILNGIQTLIIDDHPIIANAYKTILNAHKTAIFDILIAKNCDDALSMLSTKVFDIVLLDLRLPPSSDKNYLDGEDLGIYIRRKHPKTKIIVITAISNPLRFHNINKTINPEGFIMKSDMDSSDLLTAVNTVLQDKIYHSKTIETYLSEELFISKVLDDYDKKILYHLSMGEKTKDLTKLIPLSIRAIEDRKVKLRDAFNISDNSDTNLIKEAKKRRII